MIYRELGRTGLKVSVIGLGGGGFNINKDPSITKEKSREIIELAVKNGINFIDIEKDYDKEFISKAMKRVKEKLHVIIRSDSVNEEEIGKDLKDIIKKFEINPDIYEITVNSIEDLKNGIKEGVIDTLKEAKLSEKIKFTGIFSHKIEVLKEAIKTNEFDVVMTLYNTVHTKAEEIFPLKRKYNFGFIAAAPFATGILVDPKHDEHVHASGSEFMTNGNALKFVLSCEYIDAAVIGMKNPLHVNENVKIGSRKWDLTLNERNQIRKVAENFLGKDFCRMCRYCEGCERVSIADILKVLIIAKSYGYINCAKLQYSFFKERIANRDFSICEKLCPYHLPIQELIEELHEMFE